jgi:hypothetical protein
MFDNLRSAMVGAGSRGLSALVSPRLFTEGWASRFGRRLRAGVWRVRSSWWPILQVAVAASAAWYLAALLLGHEQPFVAPIATVIALGATAVDLLRASGMHLDEAAGVLDGAVCAASGNHREHPGGLASTAA